MKTPRLITAVLPAFLALGNVSFAQTITKADNTTVLGTGSSWSGGTAPGSGNIANWSGVYNTAGSLSAALPGSALSWQGISLGNITGTAAGLVSIGGTVTATTGSSVTIGTSGIDLSASNQNLVINSATTVLTGATQTWNVASGRNLRFGTSGTGGANANLDGSDSTVITVTGGGLVDANQGGATGFSDAAGFAGFNGKWIINSNTTLRGIRHGATAWGTNTAADTITLNGGTLATGGITGAVGNWHWTSNITVSAASTIDNQNISGTGRWLKLSGVITGSSGLTFASTGAGTMSADAGFILAGANTLSGTVTINSGVFVRLGGLGGTDITTGVGSTGDLGTANIVNNGTLTLSRNNTWTFANQVSGSGVLRVGVSTGSATHIVTVTGNNTHSGGTTLQTAVTLKIGSTNALGTGTFTIAGNGNFDNATGSELALSNAFMMSGGSPTFIGTSDLAFNGLTTISGANRTITVNGGALTLSGGVAEDVAGRNLTKSGSGTLALYGVSNYTGITTVTAGDLLQAKTASLYNGNAANWTAAKINVKSGATLAFRVGGTNEFSTADVSTLLTNLADSSSTTIGMNSGSNLGFDTTNASGGSFTISDAISNTTGASGGARGLAKLGPGTLVLSGVNTYTGTTTVTSGTLILSGGSALADTASVVLANASGVTLQVNASETIGNLTGGGTTGGTVAVGSNTLTVNTTTGVQVLGAAVTGTGAIVKDGTGELTLTGINTFSGTYTVNSNTLAFRGVDSENGSPAIVLGSSGSLALGSGFVDQTATISSLSGSGVVTAQFDATTGTKTLGVNQSTDTVFSGILRNTTDASARVLALAKSGSGSLTLSGSNTYSGGTTLSGGTLVAGSLTAFGTQGITLTGGILDLNGFSVANVVTNNGGTILNAVNLTPNQSGGSLSGSISGGTISGSISGTFSASGSVAGTPTITGMLKGTATFTGAVTIGSTGIHAPGNSPGVETFNAGLTYSNGSTLEWEFAGDTLVIRGTNYDGVDVTGGSFTIAAGAKLKVINLSAVDYAATDWDSVRNFTIVDNSGSGTTSGEFTLDVTGDIAIPGQGSWSVLTTAGVGGDTVLTWTPVPEPSTCAALAGLAVLGLALRRRTK